MNISRRDILTGAGSAAALSVMPRLAWSSTASVFDMVKDKAKKLAAQPFDDTIDPLPAALRDLDYAHYRMINFRGEHAIWRDHGRFRVQLFHRGFQYNRKVAINLVENGQVTPFGYSPDQFDFRANTFDTNFGPLLGFAGFRLHFPLNRPDYFDEFAVFQGASYFRVVGKGQIYGLSARGLAINTAEVDGEEFPWFREFWLERPAANAKSLTIYALLDSRSTAGSYRITLTPDTITTADVDMVLFPRKDIRKLGIAPLTSMYLHGKLDNRPFADLHPEVHDSDGLAMHNGAGEWLWRPLENPRLLRTSSFMDNAPRGFGLLQRERSFTAFEDPETSYELRPNGWVEPAGNWGKGSVQLVEIPSDSDANDNMVSYWVPDAPVVANKPIGFAYRLGTGVDARAMPALAMCVASRTGPVMPIDIVRDNRRGPRRVAVDFSGRILQRLDATKAPFPELSASTGTVGDARTERLPNGAWRVNFVYTPDIDKDGELRLTLRLGNQPLSETWTYRWGADAKNLPA